MKTKKPLFWILTSAHGVMCNDKCWRKMAAGIEDIKRFRSIGWVHRFCRKRNTKTLRVVLDHDVTYDNTVSWPAGFAVWVPLAINVREWGLFSRVEPVGGYQ